MDGFDKKDWTSYAGKISKRKDSPEWAVLREARQTHWDEFFDIRPGQKILDAGCGHGEYSVFALASGARVWAFDYSSGMTQCTRARIECEGHSAVAVTKDSVLDIPYGDGMFDTIFCLAVLDHLSGPDRNRAMQELNRVLKPNGTLYIDVPNRFAFHWRMAFNIMRLAGMYPKGEIKFFSPGEIRTLLAESGFVFIKNMGLTICPPFSGIYTTDLRRITVLPEFAISVLDRIYLALEKKLRRLPLFIPICWHHFIKVKKI